MVFLIGSADLDVLNMMSGNIPVTSQILRIGMREVASIEIRLWFV